LRYNPKVNRTTAIKCLVIFAASLLFSTNTFGQKDNKQPTGPLMTRTTTRHENYRLSYGGTVTLVGAPAGAITIEGWQKNEIDITASIELQAPDAASLDRLAVVNNFAVDVDLNHIRIMTTGTHDRAYMKQATKNFPKGLIGLPWKLDYTIKVPAMTGLEIDGGVGPINLTGVEGAIRLNALKSDANLSLTGGLVAVLIQSGTINFTVPARSWHGLGSEVRMASGNLNVDFPAGFNGDIDADVLRLGEIKNSFSELQPRERNSITPHSVRARAGSGGATLSFTMGDGTIVFKQSGAQ
jgi:hypothetical protein